MSDCRLLASEINEKLNMTDVLSTYGISVDHAGFCSCPFHGETKGSMKVYPKSYYCFGCHKGGDIINFAEQFFGLKFQDAVSRLNDDFQLGLDLRQRKTMRERNEEAKRIRELAAKREAEVKEKAAAKQRFDQALDEFVRAQRIVEKYGASHPKFAWASNNIENLWLRVQEEGENI